MVNNLLDEYKEFHKYPDAELEKTGRLVGLLIQQQLLASSRLGVALRYVLESLRRPASSPSHTRYLRFGLAALRQFSSRLPKWKQYSEHILAIPALQQYEHGLIQALASALGTSVPQASSHNPSDDAIVTAVNAAVSAETEPQDSDLLVDLPSDLGTLDLLSGDETLAKQVPTGGNANTSSGSGSGSGSKSGGSNANNSSGKGNKGGSNDSSAGADSGNGSGEDGGNGDDGDQDRNDEQKDPALSLKEEMETRRQQLRDQLGMAGPYLSEVLAALAEGTVVPKKPRGSAKKEGDNKENEEERPEEEAYDEGETKEDVRHHLDDSDDEDDVDERGVPLPDAVPRRLVVRFPEESVVDPPQKVKDKLLFVVNNITERNAESKADEVTALLDPRVYSWLSRHLVSQRLCTQPNYHVAYRTWLDRLDIPELETAITREVLIRVRVLLGSSTIRSSSDERLQLKNLGSWLGLSTLANNVPLLQRYLDLKEVIFDAYERGRLIAAVPFVAKILEHAKDSKVFQPPNPWTMGMLNALREIYN
ncbi:Cnot1, partial [Symbiodinium sp. KB8]